MFWTLDETSQDIAPVDSFCTGTSHLIADGTPVEVWWDRGTIGPSPEDSLAPLDLVSFNVFTFNGEAEFLERGTFYSPVFMDHGDFPNPTRFYLLICLPQHHRYSRSITLTRGQIAEINLGFSDWTCQETACSRCPIPETIASLTASDSTRCDGVLLDWIWDGTDTMVDSFYLYRDVVHFATLPVNERSHVDTMAISGYSYSYDIVSHNTCGRLSLATSDRGSRFPSPPTPQRVTASTDQCGQVIVQWEFITRVGVDTFFIYRHDTEVGFVVAESAPGRRSFTHVTSDRDSSLYWVTARNHVCGLPGAVSQVAWGCAVQAPLPVPFSVSQGYTDSTVISWTMISDVTVYSVYRANFDGSGESRLAMLANPTRRYFDYTGSPGVPYRYWVIATNLCGAGTATSYQIGWRGAWNPVDPDVDPLPSAYALLQNYPNPFNPSTTIEYQLPQAGAVTLSVCNLLGQPLALLVNETQPAGRYSIRFDGTALASGVYLYRLQAGNYVQTKKMMLMK
jgi:hypothetical protein